MYFKRRFLVARGVVGVFPRGTLEELRAKTPSVQIILV